MSTNEPTPAQLALTAAYSAAPLHIQAYLDSEKLGQFLMHLQSTYNLHVDTTDKLAKEIVMTLVGVLPPSELPINIRVEVGIPESLVGDIIDEINQQVFQKLRGETLSGPPAPSTPRETPPTKEEWISVGASPLQAPIQTSRPAPPSYEPPAPATSSPNTPSYMPPAPPFVGVNAFNNVQATPPQPIVSGPLPGAPAQVSPASVASLPPQKPQTPVAVPASSSASPFATFHAQVRTMTEDMQAVKAGQEPVMREVEIEAPTIVATPMPTSTNAPSPSPLATPLPPTSLPAQQTPRRPVPPTYAMPQNSAPTLSPPIMPQATPRKAPSLPSVPPPHIPGNDPYREPIE